MNVLIIYDSYFGNTEKIAKAIENAFSPNNHIKVSHVNEVGIEKLTGLDLLIIGSPTRGFRPTEPVLKFVEKIPKKGLANIKIATFDTRVLLSEIKSKVFRKVVDWGGYAAKPLALKLEKKGGKLVVPSEGFFVMDTEGPLKEGEEERAMEWVKNFNL